MKKPNPEGKPKRRQTRKDIGVLYIRCLDENTKALFKAACRKAHKSMQDVMMRLMQQYARKTIKIDTFAVRQAFKVRALKPRGFLYFRCVPERVQNNYYAAVAASSGKVNIVTEALMRAFIAKPDMFGNDFGRRQSETKMRMKAKGS